MLPGAFWAPQAIRQSVVIIRESLPWKQAAFSFFLLDALWIIFDIPCVKRGNVTFLSSGSSGKFCTSYHQSSSLFAVAKGNVHPP